MRRAKIICTLGPATSSKERIQELVDAGMDVARLNLSHGSYADHEQAYRWVREASDETGHGVGVFVDLQGPKIRLGKFKEGSSRLQTGQSFTITTREVAGNNEIASTTYEGLPGDVGSGDQILIDDGKVRLRVTEVEGNDVHTTVVVGGRISDHKGINLPGVPVSVPAMSEKDIEDLRWALHLTVDFIALSFVRSAKDVEDVRRIMREEGVLLPVIAKIEKPQAIDNLDEIVKAFDAFMVARGDLGVECPLEDVPFLQKRVVEKARRNAKPVIVATQMLESMITNPAPDARRGLRRRQRRARRRRRGDALRRDQRRGVPHRDGPHDVAHHLVHRGPRAAPHGRDRLAAPDTRRRDRQGGRGGR